MLKVKPEYCWAWKVREKQNFLVRGGGCSAGLWEEGGTEPFLHIPWLCCLVQAPSRKENGWSGKNPFPGMLGWLLAARLCCCSPNVLFWPSSCSVLLGTLWVHFPSCHSPLYFSIQVFCGFLCFFQVKFPVSTSQLLPKPQCSTPGALGCAGAQGVSGMLLDRAWHSIWGLFPTEGSPTLKDFPSFWS